MAIARKANTAPSTMMSRVSVERGLAGSVVHLVERFELEHEDAGCGVGGIRTIWGQDGPVPLRPRIRPQQRGIEFHLWIKEYWPDGRGLELDR